MREIKDILKNKREYINVNNDNKSIYINDNNVNTSKYALNREKFTPNSEEAQLAEEIASSFNDLNNYAFYYKISLKLGIARTREFWISHKKEEEEKRGTKYEFRNSKKYFAWKWKNRHY